VAGSFVRGRILAGAILGLTVLASAADANAYVVKKTTRGELVHWESDVVEYTLDGSVAANVLSGDTATRQAMTSWSGTVGAPDLSIKAPTADAPTKPQFDHKNGIFFMKDGYAPAGRALAITVLTYDNATGKILDADVIFNGSYKFAVLGNEAPNETEKTLLGAHPSTTDTITHEEEVSDVGSLYDLHHVIAHELGHSLGMNDEMERKDALMYRYTAPNDATLRAPSDDDVAGLAELYSTKLEGKGNGCGGATVSPKKPTFAASQIAMFGALTLMAFLLFRARNDKRARLAFVAAAAAITVGLLPSTSGKSGPGVAKAAEIEPGHARAKIVGTDTVIADGLFKTTYKLATVACRASACPKLGHGEAWGGTVGNITQEVGGQYAPHSDDVVDVSFKKLPDVSRALRDPLAGRVSDADEAVRVLTKSL
jgi:hypothetical protein